MPGFFIEAIFDSLLVLSVTGAELIDTTSSVNQCVLSGIEGMASRTHFYFDHRILVSVVPSLTFFTLGAALPEKTPFRSQVLKNDSAVIVWMDSFFHGDV